MHTTVVIFSGAHGTAYTLVTTNRGARYTLEAIEVTPTDDWKEIADYLVSEYQRFSPWDLATRPALERKLRAFARVICPDSRERVRRDNEYTDIVDLIESTGFSVIDVR